MTTARHQRFAADGTLLEEVLEEVPAETIERDGAPDRLRNVLSTLAQWEADFAAADTAWPTLTAGQKDARNRLAQRRLGAISRGLRDMLMRWEP